MIKKILHFIWFGNDIPSYVNFSIDNFSIINSDFKIHFLNYTINQIENIKINNIDDYILKNTIEQILKHEKKYKEIIDHCKINKLKFIQVLSDIYRLEILNYYGGIYLDCDCFPLKKFDEDLLYNNQFIVQRHFNQNYIENDNYFIGSIMNNEKLFNIFNNKLDKNIKKIIQTEKGQYNSIKYLQLKKKFIECKLKIGESFSNSDFYIDHYSLKTWKDQGNGIHTPSCLFDRYKIY